MVDINWMAAVAAGVLGFFVGGLWYSPAMFLKPWMAAMGQTEPHAYSLPAPVRFGIGIAVSVAAALLLAAHLGPRPPLAVAMRDALLAGALFAGMAVTIQALFEGRPGALRLALINSGYHVAQFAVFGLVLGLWH